MEKTTEENTSTNEGEYLLKEIELNLKHILKNSPSEIKDQIEEFYNQFIFITKGPEKDQAFEKIDILNTIINNTSDTL